MAVPSPRPRWSGCTYTWEISAEPSWCSSWANAIASPPSRTARIRAPRRSAASRASAMWLPGSTVGKSSRCQLTRRSTHVVVGDLLDGDLGRRRQGGVMAHPHEPLSQPAERFERLAERLRRAGVLEVDAPVRHPGERLVGERGQLLGAHARVALHPDRVQVVVARDSASRERPSRAPTARSGRRTPRGCRDTRPARGPRGHSPERRAPRSASRPSRTPCRPASSCP